MMNEGYGLKRVRPNDIRAYKAHELGTEQREMVENLRAERDDRWPRPSGWCLQHRSRLRNRSNANGDHSDGGIAWVYATSPDQGADVTDKRDAFQAGRDRCAPTYRRCDRAGTGL